VVVTDKSAPLLSTVTVKEQVAVFPAASVAVQVTVEVPMGKKDPEAGEQLTSIGPGQLSVTVGLGYVTIAPFSPGSLGTVTSAGQVITGASVSSTVTVKEQLAVFPDGSVAVQVTVVVPTGKKEPEAGEQLTVTGQLSVTVGSGNVTKAPHSPGSLEMVISTGQVITGGSVSFTVTVKEHVAVLPAASVAVQVTVVFPTGKKVPDAGVQVAVAPGQLSVTVGSGNVTIAPH
jgi:hypothetical protein